MVGTVYDSFTNQAVPNVKIVENMQKEPIYSDSLGRFSLNVKDGLDKVHVDFIKTGYNEKHLKIPTNLDSINIFITPLNYKYDDIVVTDSKVKQMGLKRISESKINEGLSKNMSDLLRNSYGISSTEMGEAVSRPVLNGLSGNRLRIVTNDFTTKDMSANSPDHAQAYTLNSVKGVSLLSGPDLIRYSSSLVGRSVHTNTNLTIDSKIEKNTSLFTATYGSMNNKFSLATKNELNYLFDGLVLNGIYTKTGDVYSALGRLDNTSYNLYEFSFATLYSLGEFSINPYGSIFRKDYGVPGGFVGSHPHGVDISMKRNTYGFNSQYHLHNRVIDKLKLDYERNFYDHKEFEHSGLVGAQFRFVSNSVRLELIQHQGSVLENGYIGFSLVKKDNELGGFVFIPNNRYLVWSSYINEQINIAKDLNAKAGVRYEIANIDLDKPYSFNNSVYENLAFNSLSGSLALNYDLSENSKLNFIISNSNRVPEPEELFSDGPHLAAYSYEIGNPDLQLEKSISYSLNGEFATDNWKFTSELFYYDYSNYITPTATGDTNYSTLLPIYRQVNMPAKLYGINLSLDYDITSNLIANSNFSYTIGKEKLTDSYLPLIPPAILNLDLIYKLSDWEFKLSSIMATSQEDVGRFEERTDGYIVFNAQIKRNIVIGDRLLTVIGELNNITNEVYRNHLSRIKSVYPQPGIGAELTVNFYL